MTKIIDLSKPADTAKVVDLSRPTRAEKIVKGLGTVALVAGTIAAGAAAAHAFCNPKREAGK